METETIGTISEIGRDVFGSPAVLLLFCYLVSVYFGFD